MAALALPTVTATASDLPDEWRQRNNASLQADGADEYEMAVVQYFLDRSLDACMKTHFAAAPRTATPAQLRKSYALPSAFRPFLSVLEGEE